MKQILTCILVALPTLLQSQKNCDPNLFRLDKPTVSFQTTESISQIAKDSNLRYIDFTIFEPSVPDAPFIMFIHGGGFETGDKTDEYTLCKMFAERGFVTASINYSLGKSDPLNPNLYLGYQAQQDAHIAWNYFRLHCEEFGIDTNNMFVAGKSAGAMMALAMAFISQDDWNQKIPEAEKKFGIIPVISRPAGVIDMWGAIGDVNYISKAEALSTPIIMFHGLEDKVCPYDKAGPPEYPQTLYGSKAIAKRYEEFGANYQLYFGKHISHGNGFNEPYLRSKINRFLFDVLCFNSKTRIEENVGNLSLFEFSPRPTLKINGLNFIERIILSVLCIVLLICSLKQKGLTQKIVSFLFIFGIWSMWFNLPWSMRVFYSWTCYAIAFISILLIKQTTKAEKGFVCLITGILFLRSFLGVNHFSLTYWVSLAAILPILWGVIYMVKRKKLENPHLRSFSIYLLVECVIALKSSLSFLLN